MMKIFWHRVQHCRQYQSCIWRHRLHQSHLWRRCLGCLPGLSDFPTYPPRVICRFCLDDSHEIKSGKCWDCWRKTLIAARRGTETTPLYKKTWLLSNLYWIYMALYAFWTLNSCHMNSTLPSLRQTLHKKALCSHIHVICTLFCLPYCRQYFKRLLKYCTCSIIAHLTVVSTIDSSRCRTYVARSVLRPPNCMRYSEMLP
jgi:hypothetical protein